MTDAQREAAEKVFEQIMGRKPLTDAELESFLGIKARLSPVGVSARVREKLLALEGKRRARLVQAMAAGTAGQLKSGR